MDSRVLGIVGMRRSGTSSLCLALNRLGVYFGAEGQLLAADAHNEEGYWEHKTLVSVHRMFRASMSLRSVDCDPLPPDWRERPGTEAFLAQGVRCIQRSFPDSGRPWAWKDPDASLALQFVYELSRRASLDTQLIICVRNPRDVAKSELRRKGTPELETIGAWMGHTLAALHGSKSKPRVVFEFSEYLNTPRRFLEPAVKVLGLSPSEEMWSEAVGTVRRDRVHSSSRLEELAGCGKRRNRKKIGTTVRSKLTCGRC